MRWRRAFLGQERQLGELRRWLTGLLPDRPARDDVVLVAVELATNAVKFTGSGHGGWFIVEIAWYRGAVRVAVADEGAPTGPRLIDDPLGEQGRGLQMVRALSVNAGVTGDERGRLVWADVPWSGERAHVPRSPAAGLETALHHDQLTRASRHPRQLTDPQRAGA
jgi:hypothetical protein